MAGLSEHIALGEPSREPRIGKAERDLVALGVAVAAIILFVGTGGTVLPRVVHAWLDGGTHPDAMLTNALLLNIALIIFGWRRYNDLAQEVKERRRAEQLARQLAETDALTGLLNRRSFAPTGGRLIGEALQTKRGAAVLLIDLDNFKQVNDLHGHKTGDRLLIETADRMGALMPVGAALARLGGDEFACLVNYDARTPDKLDQLAATLIETIAKPYGFDGSSFEVTVSIGIAATNDEVDLANPEECVQTLTHHADIAMYHAKKQGRNRYAWFEATMESELRFRNELETGIRRGIAQGEFVPYYEQQIDLQTGDLVGFEMLARWNSPLLGLVSPDIFIPIAEEIGVIGELSECLIRQAFRDAKEWDPALTLSINISPIQLRDPWFSQKLLRLLVECNFPANRLDIEITESCLHENIGVVRSVVTSLKNQGIQISLDDFGTGYSSLAQLRSLPFDRLKIDRSFVRELAQEGANSKVVEAIVSLGRGLDLPITAEGVENDLVLAALRKMGGLKGQGYYYGRPEDAARTLDRLARKQLLAVLQQVDEEEDARHAREEEVPAEPDPVRKAAR
ncbi:MAG TPA: EAL domain-containing protein [Sphingomonadaceae bacterium]